MAVVSPHPCPQDGKRRQARGPFCPDSGWVPGPRPCRFRVSQLCKRREEETSVMQQAVGCLARAAGVQVVSLKEGGVSGSSSPGEGTPGNTDRLEMLRETCGA